MATTFSLTSGSYDGRYLKLTCTQTKNIASNTSTITWTLESIGGSSTYYYTGPTTVTINGTQVYSQARIGEGGFPGTKGSKTGTTTVNHTTDGSKAIAVSFSTAIYTKTISTYSGTWTLDNNPRGATINSAPNITDETESITVTYSNPAGNSATTLKLHLSKDNLSNHFASWNLPKDKTTATFPLNDIIKYNLRGTSIDMWGDYKFPIYYAIETVIGDYSDWDSLTKECEIVDCTPDIDSFVAADINDETVMLTGDSGTIVRGHSVIEYEFDAVSTYKGATITKYYATIDNDRQEGESGSFYNPTSGNIAYSVVDTRGKTQRGELKLNFIPYIDVTCNPKISIALQGETAATITVETTGKFYNGSFGAEENYLYLEARYKMDNGSYGSWFALTEAGTVNCSDNTYSHTTSFGVPNYDSSYVVEVRARDRVSAYTAAPYTLKLIPVFDWSDTDFNFNVPVKINGIEQDYIIEQGTKDNWTYKKWNSGIMECWRRLQITTNVSGAWGSLYTSGSLAATNLTYPYAFTELPMLSVNLMPFGVGGFLMMPGSSYGSATNTGALEIARGTSATNSSFLINYHAIGRWK